MMDGKFYVLDSDEDSSDEELYASKPNKAKDQNKRQREYKRNLKKAKEESDDELGNLNDGDK